MRAASSKGAADLIVLWPTTNAAFLEMPGQVWLVQCKRDGRLSKSEAAELRRITDETGTIPVLAKVGNNGRGVEFVFLNEQEC